MSSSLTKWVAQHPPIFSSFETTFNRATHRPLSSSHLDVTVAGPDAIAGRVALVVEDGPTLTHGGMSIGAGFLAAQRYKCAQVLDPRNFAVGSIARAYVDYPHIGNVLPALGYSDSQVQELNDTIDASKADILIDASPAGLSHIINTEIPIVRVRYEFRQVSGSPLNDLVARFLS